MTHAMQRSVVLLRVVPSQGKSNFLLLSGALICLDVESEWTIAFDGRRWEYSEQMSTSLSQQQFHGLNQKV